jgi:methyl-accepting chemotaxis protein
MAMLAKLFRFTIGRKIYAVIGMAFLGFLCVMAFTMRDIRIGMEKEKTEELKHLVQVALSIAKEEHENATKGTITDEEARKRAAARIGVMRYGNNDYYWINDMHPRMVMHPIQARLNGSDLTENKDPNGKRLFIEFVETVKKSGAGVVAYEWPKPGATAPQPKMSYVAGFQPWGWVIGTGVYIDNLENDVWNMAQRALIFAGIVMLLTGIVCLLVTRGISRAMRGMTAGMRELASGNFDVVIPGRGRKDEIGDMVAAVDAFKDKAVEKAQLEAEQKQGEDERAAVERRNAMIALADRFESAVGEIVNTVSSASGELEASANSLTRTAENTQSLSATVAATSEQASANVQSVASATEEMSASVSEIARQVQESSNIAADAVRQAEKTDARINELSQAAARIGDVVDLISAVAQQTNLLALNATIEAARAGEAGKGFAVVAQEVKALAAQTAKATDEISTQIAAMQSATQDSVTAIKDISGTINRISEIASVIAAAVEEQGAATQEISRNVAQAATGTTQVASNITEVNRGAAETGSASASLLTSAQSLSGESNRLKVEVDKFLATVRAA